MLNRRILRIKAMQSIYAFKKSEESNFHLGLERIAEFFKERLLEKGVEAKWDLMEQQDKASALFKEHLIDGVADDVLGKHPIEVSKPTWEAILFYRTQINKERRQFMEQMIDKTENLFSKYLRSLQLIVTLADRIKKVQQDKEDRGAKSIGHFERFFDNQLLPALRNNGEVVKENYHWDPGLIMDWAITLRKDEAFIEHLKVAPETLEGNRDVLLFVFREFLFKNESILSNFELADLNWTENKSVLSSLLSKTLKSIDDSGDISVLSLSKNWEDDKDFFKELFRTTVDKEKDWEVRIEHRTKRWSSDHIAAVDKILLKMALSEMVAFHSIPVKVTINEYIEISKSYSTPKSWQFMNGVLDAISNDMKEEGLIRKSGRGLLDNK